jgi:hypothetical protein
VSSLLTAWHPADLAQCAAQFGVLSAVLLGFAAGFVWLWPYRLRHQCYLTPVGLAPDGFKAALYVLTATVAIHTAGLVMSLMAEAKICASGAEEGLVWSVSVGRVLPPTADALKVVLEVAQEGSSNPTSCDGRRIGGRAGRVARGFVWFVRRGVHRQ